MIREMTKCEQEVYIAYHLEQRKDNLSNQKGFMRWMKCRKLMVRESGLHSEDFMQDTLWIVSKDTINDYMKRETQ